MGKFWKDLECKRFVHILYVHLEQIMVLWYILWPFGNFLAIWYVFPRFGTLCQEKSGNPGSRDIFTRPFKLGTPFTSKSSPTLL
jgi:hypothetical protein